jgi:hypothetical protein
MGELVQSYKILTGYLKFKDPYKFLIAVWFVIYYGQIQYNGQQNGNQMIKEGMVMYLVVK